MYYLYNDPATGKLTWFSWDHDITFRQELMPFLVLDKSIVTDAWPLIRWTTRSTGRATSR